MSHLQSLIANKLTNIDALRRAVDRMANAKISLSVDETSIHGRISIGNNYRQTLTVNYVGPKPILVENGKLQQGGLDLSADNMFTDEVNRAFGVGASKLLELYNREAAAIHYEEIYGQGCCTFYEHDETGKPMLEVAVPENI